MSAGDRPLSSREYSAQRREARAIRKAVLGAHLDPDQISQLSAKLVFELFSGTRNFVKSCVSRGFMGRAFDFLDDPAFDIMDDKVFAKLLTMIDRRQIFFLWIGLPCCTWSRARRGGRGPGPLRSDEIFCWLTWLARKKPC